MFTFLISYGSINMDRIWVFNWPIILSVECTNICSTSGYFGFFRLQKTYFCNRLIENPEHPEMLYKYMCGAQTVQFYFKRTSRFCYYLIAISQYNGQWHSRWQYSFLSRDFLRNDYRNYSTRSHRCEKRISLTKIVRRL